MSTWHLRWDVNICHWNMDALRLHPAQEGLNWARDERNMSESEENNKTKCSNPRRGDIFVVPICRDSFALGKIIETWRSTLLVVVFSGQVATLAYPDLKGLKIDLLAITFDALLHNGTWPIVGADAVDQIAPANLFFLIGPPED